MIKAGYGQLRSKDPRNPAGSGFRTRTTHRMAIVGCRNSLDVDPGLQASYPYYKELCVNTDHINLKENNVYNVRNSCFDRDTCSDHVNSLRQKEPAGLLDLWCGKYCYKIY